jgi:hypothetical protein
MACVFSKSFMTTVSVGAQTEPIDSKINFRIPDPEGNRFCTNCQSWLPVGNFPSGPRRYCCKIHRWERFGKQAKRKHMANTENKLLFTLWLKAYSDSKLFKSVWDNAPAKQGSSNPVAQVKISQKEIKKLLQCMVNTFNITSVVNTFNITSTMNTMYKDLVELGRSTAVVPVSPEEMVTISNAALVPSTVKRQLLKAFRSDGSEGYKRALRVAEAQTNTVFRPSTEQLCEMQEKLVSNSTTLLPEI